MFSELYNDNLDVATQYLSMDARVFATRTSDGGGWEGTIGRKEEKEVAYVVKQRDREQENEPTGWTKRGIDHGKTLVETSTDHR